MCLEMSKKRCSAIPELRIVKLEPLTVSRVTADYDDSTSTRSEASRSTA